MACAASLHIQLKNRDPHGNTCELLFDEFNLYYLTCKTNIVQYESVFVNVKVNICILFSLEVALSFDSDAALINYTDKAQSLSFAEDSTRSIDRTLHKCLMISNNNINSRDIGYYNDKHTIFKKQPNGKIQIYICMPSEATVSDQENERNLILFAKSLRKNSIPNSFPILHIITLHISYF